MVNKTIIASGILAGAIGVYAYTNKVSSEDMNIKLYNAKTEIQLILDDLLELSAELLTRLYTIITKLFKTLVYNLQSKMHDFQMEVI